MAGVQTLDLEIQVNMTADRFFNSFKNKKGSFTDKTEAVSIHHDDTNSNSSIQIWNLIVDGKMEQIKEKTEVDEENMSVSFLAMEGDVLEQYKSYKIILDVVPKDDGVCIAKWKWEYEKLNDDVPPPTKYIAFVADYTRDLETSFYPAVTSFLPHRKPFLLRSKDPEGYYQRYPDRYGGFLERERYKPSHLSSCKSLGVDWNSSDGVLPPDSAQHQTSTSTPDALQAPSYTVNLLYRRFTAEEKGKAKASVQTGVRRIKISAPDFDPAELIRENALTLIARLTNPKEQNMISVLSFLPKKWNLLGRVAGSELGNDCFQFRFEDETELRRVLHEGPYQFGRWMIIIQRWEPIISPTFPSEIPFWINIRGIPLHFWHEQIIRNIGIELGVLENYQLTKSSARIRIALDGLQPIIKDTILEFPSGEETTLTLDYENLGNHCSICNRLTHLRSYCPDRTELAPSIRNEREAPLTREINREGRNSMTRREPRKEIEPQDPQRGSEANPEPFHQRLDRHGRPFGHRVAPTSTTTGLRNKITPAATLREERIEPAGKQQANYPHRSYYGNSPSYSTRRESQRPTHEKGHSVRKTPPRRSPNEQLHRQWRAKITPTNNPSLIRPLR
ncbi:hypothetical protein Bca101_054238 [Brassica carinata]